MSESSSPQAPQSDRPQQPQQPGGGRVRFGIVGVGIIGRQHAERLTSDVSPATLVAVADQNAEAAAAVAADHGVESAASVGELLAREDIDAIIIAVPSGLHADVTIEALDAGKHVLLEKPIEITVEAADRIRDAEQRSGRILTVASQRRFAAENQFLKQLVTDGTLGRLTSATVEVPLWRPQEYYDSGAWRGTWKLDGGGALMNQGVHLVDLTLWLLGEVEELYAHTGLLAHERIEVEDTVTVTARLRSGAQLTFQATTAAYGRLPIRMNLMGDAGSVVTENERVVHFHSREELELPEFETVTIMLEQLTDFVRAIENDSTPLVTSAEARAAVAFIEAVYESGRTGRPVRPAELPLRLRARFMDRADAATDATETQRWWRQWLGAEPDLEGSWRLGQLRQPVHPAVRGQIRRLHIFSYGSELTCEFYRPTGATPTGVVVVVPFYDTPSLFEEPTARTRRAGRDPALNAHGLQLVEAGHAVLAVPWWFEQVAAADPATAEVRSLEERYGPAAQRHRREQPMTALGRSIGDLMLAVTTLIESGLADGSRIAAFGHSLGAKLTLHLAALDQRIEVAAAHEGGLGLAHSNWSDPWYLNGAVPDGRDHDELLGLVAPRPFLLAGGGDGDGEHNLELFRSARRRWPDEKGLDLLLHDGGHPLPRHVMAGIREWITDRTNDISPPTSRYS